MNLRAQLDLLLPTTGRRCMFLGTSKRNQFFDTNEQLAQAIEARHDERAVYFALASFGQEDRRTQENAQQLRCLYIDVDCGPDKHAKDPEGTYATAKEGLTAIVAFQKGLGFAPSLLVRSGMGFHVYLALDRDYPTAEVQRVGIKIKALAKAQGFRIDPAVPADTARVLRPVGSLHSINDAGEVRVQALQASGVQYTLAQIEARIDDELPDFEVPAYARDEGINKDILAYPERSASMVKIADHCAAIRMVRDAGGEVPEPVWRGMLGLTKFCDVDGEEAAHRWSEGDADYTYEETEAKRAGWKGGPPLCDYFADSCSQCASCKFRGKIKTPLHVGYVDVQIRQEAPKETQEPTAEEPATVSLDSLVEEPEVKAVGPMADPHTDRPDLFTVPEREGFFFRAEGRDWRLYHRKLVEQEDATGDVIKAMANVHVADKLFWIESCIRGEEDDGINAELELVIVDRPSSKAQRRFHVPAATLQDLSAFSKQLLQRGVIFADATQAPRSVQKFIINEYRRVQHTMKPVVRYRFGYDWHESNEFLCAMGGVVVRQDGSLLKAVTNPAINGAKKLLRAACLPESPQGSWGPDIVASTILPAAKRYAAFVRQYLSGPSFAPHRFALALALGSPYLCWATGGVSQGSELPEGGLVVSLYSKQSGLGKSSLQKLAAMAFGDGLMIGGDNSLATPAARLGVVAGLGIYPFMLDEVSRNQLQQQATEILTYANGMPKQRATRSGATRTDVRNWSLITMMSTNCPQSELMATDKSQSEALLYRLLEINFDDAPKPDGTIQTQYGKDASQISRDGGAIGLLLALRAVRSGADKMNADGLAVASELAEKLKSPTETRFYVRAMAATLMVNRVLARMGVELFDEAELLQQFDTAVGNALALVRKNKCTPEEQFACMMADMADNIVVTAEWPKVGLGAKNTPLLNHPRSPVVGRYTSSDGRVRLSVRAVRDWCAKQHVSFQALTTALRAQNIMWSSPDDKTKPLQAKLSPTLGVPSIAPIPRGEHYVFNVTSRSRLRVVDSRDETGDYADDDEAVGA